MVLQGPISWLLKQLQFKNQMSPRIQFCNVSGVLAEAFISWWALAKSFPETKSYSLCFQPTGQASILCGWVYPQIQPVTKCPILNGLTTAESYHTTVPTSDTNNHQSHTRARDPCVNLDTQFFQIVHRVSCPVLKQTSPCSSLAPFLAPRTPHIEPYGNQKPLAQEATFYH